MDEKRFDLRTHIRDPKTGVVVKKNTYRLHIKNGVKIFERGGKKYHENGDEISAPVEAPKVEAPKVEPKKEDKKIFG